MRSQTDRLGMVQFHQSYAYEDFIQGYRPSGTGFRLKNGVFYEFCEKAKKDPAGTYVFIIDEINRGNLSKVFGELMLLIEADKRGPEWGIPLTYSEDTESKFYIPENLYLIGLNEHRGSVAGDGRLCIATTIRIRRSSPGLRYRRISAVPA